MDIVGRFDPTDGTEVKAVTGVDDHSRDCVCARIVARATAKPVCDALLFALKQHGAPNEILTDNGMVSPLDRPGPRTGALRPDLPQQRDQTPPHGPVLADHDGQVERFHRTYRNDFRSITTEHMPPSKQPDGPRRLGGEVQHRAPPPVPGRPTAGRVVRPGCPQGPGRDLRRGRGDRQGPTPSPLSAGRQPMARSTGLDRLEQFAIGSFDLRRRSRSKSSSRTASSRSSIKASSSLPTPSGVGTRPRSRRHRGPGRPAGQLGLSVRSSCRRRRIDLVCWSALSGRAQSAGTQRRGGHRGAGSVQISVTASNGLGAQTSDQTQPFEVARCLRHAQGPSPHQEVGLMGLDCKRPTGANP